MIDLASLQAKDYLTIAVSGLALVVAAYGVIERRRGSREARRIRLTEVLDELLELTLDQGILSVPERPEDGARATPFIIARREVLCAMALALLDRGAEGVSGREYAALAQVLQRSGDWSRARISWTTAVDRSKGSGSYEIFVSAD